MSSPCRRYISGVMFCFVADNVIHCGYKVLEKNDEGEVEKGSQPELSRG